MASSVDTLLQAARFPVDIALGARWDPDLVLPDKMREIAAALEQAH
jgi:hypothetical protein